jgi:hypothetical protein
VIFGSGAVSVGRKHWRNKKASGDNIFVTINHETIVTEMKKCSERSERG